jgi:hypothetical protein
LRARRAATFTSRGERPKTSALNCGPIVNQSLLPAWMPALWRLEVAFEVQPGLLARTPRATTILQPLLSQLLDRHASAVLLEAAHGAHFVIPVVVDRRRPVAFGKIREPQHRGDLMFVGPREQHGDNLRRPHGFDSIAVIHARELHRLRGAQAQAQNGNEDKKK